MTDTSPEALDALIDELRARAFAIQHNAAPETVRLLRVAAAALTAVRRGVNAMRADNARLREALANAVGALDAAGEDLSEFANILSREPNEANLTYQSARDAQDALALPLDAPAPAVDPVAEAARVLLSDDITISKMAQAIHDGPLGADDEWFSAARPQGAWCVDAVRASLRALAQETRHD